MHKCPGQDPTQWKPEDITEVACPSCGYSLEFWKDEPKRDCPGCKKCIRNPKLDLGCAEWCKFADKCLGIEQEKK